MTDRGGGASSLPYMQAGVTGSDDDDELGGGGRGEGEDAKTHTVFINPNF